MPLIRMTNCVVRTAGPVRTALWGVRVLLVPKQSILYASEPEYGLQQST